MEEKTWIKIGFEAAIIINALCVIGWVFLSIFPGVFYLGEGHIGLGFQLIFLNGWFYVFAISLVVALVLNTYRDDEVEETI